MDFKQLNEKQPILAICYDFDKTLSPVICSHRDIFSLLDMM